MASNVPDTSETYVSVESGSWTVACGPLLHHKELDETMDMLLHNTAAITF
jgi:hypothetical protein